MPSLRFLFQSGLREVFSNPSQQVMRWQLVFINPQSTTPRNLDNVDLQILWLSFTAYIAAAGKEFYNLSINYGKRKQTGANIDFFMRYGDKTLSFHGSHC